MSPFSYFRVSSDFMFRNIRIYYFKPKTIPENSSYKTDAETNLAANKMLDQ